MRLPVPPAQNTGKTVQPRKDVKSLLTEARIFNESRHSNSDLAYDISGRMPAHADNSSNATRGQDIGWRDAADKLRRTADAFREFFRDRSGNVAMIFALASVPMVGLIGAAVDYSRASSDRSALQVAVDAAALAGARQLPKGKSEVKSAVDGFMKANMPLSYRGMPYEVKIDQNEKKVLVTVSVKVPTSFLKAVGTNNVEVLARSEAGTGVENSEVVLALDITGTMRNHIPSLKQGAQELVRLLFEARVGSDDLRMGIVPYVASVNIGDHPSRMDWMDIGARARYHGENFTNTLFRDKRCDPPPPPPPPTPIVTGPGPGPIAPASNNNGNGNSNPGPPKPPPPPPPPAPWSPDLGSLDKAPSGRPVFAELGTDIRAGIDFLLDALGPSKAQAGPGRTARWTSPRRFCARNGSRRRG